MVSEDSSRKRRRKAEIGDGVIHRSAFLFVTTYLCLSLLWTLPLFLGSNGKIWLLAEDGPIENASAILYLTSGLAFLMFWFRCRIATPATGALLLGLLMVFIAGEEISWGQRIFGWSTPEGYANVQGETTIHNHVWFDKQTAGRLSMSHFFEVFCVGYGVVLNIAVLHSSRIGALRSRLGLPLAPMILGIAFPMNYMMSKLYGLSYSPELSRIAELRECAHAVVWAAIAVYLLTTERQRSLSR